MRSLPSASQRRRYHAAAVSLARTARSVIARRLARGFGIRRKLDRSFVTDVDLEVEDSLRALLQRRFPRHGIYGEERDAVRPDAEFQWIIDPIDGTLSFTRGIPLYGTIIALHYRSVPLVGVIDHPGLGTRYSAARGLGAFRDGKRIRLADARAGNLAEEIISAADRPRFAQCGSAAGFDRLLRIHPQVRGYTDCVAHTMAAEGAIGAAIDYGLRLWDIAATQVLIEEAGGRYVVSHESLREGKPYYGIICGKPRVVNYALRLLRS